jgi:hypothetical protein
MQTASHYSFLSKMEPHIILYDIIVNPEKNKRQAASLNTWKTRYFLFLNNLWGCMYAYLGSRLVLNYKSIPYKTVWVEYVNIQRACQAIGATATEKRPNGEPRYTLPTIVVADTGEVISDSAKIAVYLDARYPDKPLFPVDKVGEQLAYEAQLFHILGMVSLNSILDTSSTNKLYHLGSNPSVDLSWSQTDEIG